MDVQPGHVGSRGLPELDGIETTSSMSRRPLGKLTQHTNFDSLIRGLISILLSVVAGGNTAILSRVRSDSLARPDQTCQS